MCPRRLFGVDAIMAMPWQGTTRQAVLNVPGMATVDFHWG
jgi:hypothetical protein